MKRTFDVDALRAMIVGVELGSFARAAAELGRSQSAVSSQLRRLEEVAGRQLFRRQGRGLVLTEAGDALLGYARRILALNDEAAASVGAKTAAPTVRVGLPQDLFDDVMPKSMARFAKLHPQVHVELKVGRNWALEQEIQAGRLDIAIAYFEAGSKGRGVKLLSQPLRWYGMRGTSRPMDKDASVPMILFDHPCLFRQTALQALEREGRRWHVPLTTPSLAGVWGALKLGLGVTVRVPHRLPLELRDVGAALGLPRLPTVELHILKARALSPIHEDLAEILAQAARQELGKLL